MIYNFLLTVLSEGHFRIVANRFNAFHFFLATMVEGPHKWINLGHRIS